MTNRISILYPNYENVNYKQISEVTLHDLALDQLVKSLSDKEIEQNLILNVIAKITSDQRVATFRSEVFDDIYRLPEFREEMMKLLDEVKFLKDFGSFKRDYDKKAGIWDLLHRLEEINDYILCIEKIRKCLDNADIHSQGLKNLKSYVDGIYYDAAFDKMKTDIANLKADTSNIKSITLGINLDERFETEGVGIISVNNKPFKHSGIVSNFAKSFASRDQIVNEAGWNEKMTFIPVAEDEDIDVAGIFKAGALIQAQSGGIASLLAAKTVISMPAQDGTTGFSHYLSRTCDQMLSTTVKNLREILSGYVNISIRIMTELIPEFIYYIRFAEFIEKKISEGFTFTQSRISANEDISMKARDFYNIKLILSDHKPSDIVVNDLDFDRIHSLYVLTGANRGGKTTITQAVGQLYTLSQGGIYAPAGDFEYIPVDSIYTHFPADEDKTLDLGRLGEECTRFKNMYQDASSKSLILMNESFSTTSFEEGYFIAKDSVRALLDKGARVIYNTHMHKLALDIDDINSISDACQASSLIVKVEDNDRSFKVVVAPPEGMSYASDIAAKYGVTYEMLTKG